jgi:hypothetical protein
MRWFAASDHRLEHQSEVVRDPAFLLILREHFESNSLQFILDRTGLHLRQIPALGNEGIRAFHVTRIAGGENDGWLRASPTANSAAEMACRSGELGIFPGKLGTRAPAA